MPPDRPPRSQVVAIRSMVLRWLICSLAIFASVYVVPGIHFTGPGWELGIVALIFGLVNALLRPLLLALTCLTFGVFGLLVNALLLALTSALAAGLGIDFVVDGFWPAFWGGLVVALVSMLLSILAGEQRVDVRIGRGAGPNQ